MGIKSFFLGKEPRRATRSRGRPHTAPAFRRERRLAMETLEPRLAPAVLLPGFAEFAAASGLSNATAMELAPSGKLYIAEQAGTMEVWQNGIRLRANFFANTSLRTQTVSERGLLGLALDPNFASNHFVYVYYTTTAADNHNRVSRFTADASGNLALAGSQKVLLELNPHAAGNHNGGAIHFGPDGKLYIAVGDNANQNNPTGTHNSQRLTTLHGKILRINADGTIPSDNPFVGQTTGKNRAIWARGLRNPFTFSFEPGTGRMFINDVGQSTWEEINVGAPGANYGWPATEGSFNPAAFPNFTQPLFAYNHSPAVSDPSGVAITGGAFYNPSINQFGADYAGDYFFADFGGDWIYRIDPATQAVMQFAANVPSPVDLEVDAAGNLYYLARGSGQVFVVLNAAALSPGLRAEFFDFTTRLSGLPSLRGRTADVVRTDAAINFPSTTQAWAGLDSRFADTFVLRETGYLRVDAPGTYTLYLSSNDGSKLWLDGRLLINNGGLHAMRERSVTVRLSAGFHRLRTEFFENQGPAGMIVSWRGPGIAKQAIPAASLFQIVPVAAS